MENLALRESSVGSESTKLYQAASPNLLPLAEDQRDRLAVYLADTFWASSSDIEVVVKAMEVYQNIVNTRGVYDDLAVKSRNALDLGRDRLLDLVVENGLPKDELLASKFHQFTSFPHM